MSAGGYSYLITASGSDSNSNSSGTKGFQFSLNNGSSWSNVQTSSKFTVSSTTAANFTHNVKVRVVDNAGNSATSSSTINITPTRALIYQLYEQLLGREPAISEVDTHNASTNATSISMNIAASKEANQRLSNNYTNYAKALYNGILGRAPSSSETSAVANWALLLENSGVVFTVRRFTASSEFQQICSKYSIRHSA